MNFNRAAIYTAVVDSNVRCFGKASIICSHSKSISGDYPLLLTSLFLGLKVFVGENYHHEQNRVDEGLYFEATSLENIGGLALLKEKKIMLGGGGV